MAIPAAIPAAQGVLGQAPRCWVARSKCPNQRKSRQESQKGNGRWWIGDNQGKADGVEIWSK
jgi:hypothetical protein